jgi:hypothetical protein
MCPPVEIGAHREPLGGDGGQPGRSGLGRAALVLGAFGAVVVVHRPRQKCEQVHVHRDVVERRCEPTQSVGISHATTSGSSS